MKFKVKSLLCIVFAAVMCFSVVLFGCNGTSETPPTTVSVQSVTLDKQSATVAVGGTVTLTAAVSPDDATDKGVSWSSSAPEVATVSGGVVTGVSAGQATITVKTDDGGKTAACKVTVNPNVTKLEAPVISLSGNAISWTAVSHADGYDVYENGNKVTSVTTASYVITATEAGNYEYAVVATSTDASYSDSDKSNAVTYTVLPTDNTPVIYLAGDSTVQAYADDAYIAGWGQYLDLFLEDDVVVVNAARGGRSSRSFINEGRLFNNKSGENAVSGFKYTFSENNGKSIEETIKEGDYLFIQFGHNDDDTKKYASTSTMPDRLSPLGTADTTYNAQNLPEYAGTRVPEELLAETYKNGVFPATEGTRLSTSELPDEYLNDASNSSSDKTKMQAEIAKYGDTYYSYESGATFKWYLSQYVDFARSVGATPVLVTPVARQGLNSDGTLKDGPGNHGDNWAYVQAVRQLADEKDVLLIDLFADTKELFETATKDYAEYLMSTVPSTLAYNGSYEWPTAYDAIVYNAKNGGDIPEDDGIGNEVPDANTGTTFEKMDGTHYNKYGAFWTAAKVAEAIVTTTVDGAGEREYFDFTDNVKKTPEEYYNPSNLISKTKIGQIEALLGNGFSITDPDRQYPSPANVEAKFNALFAGKTLEDVTEQNYQQILDDCAAVLDVYNRLNVDDKPSVPQTVLEQVAAFENAAKAKRPRPERTEIIYGENIAAGAISGEVTYNMYGFTKTDATITELERTFKIGNENNVAASANSAEYNGRTYSFTQYIELNGNSSNYTKRYVEFDIEESCTVTIIALNTHATDERTVNIAKSDGTGYKLVTTASAAFGGVMNITTIENMSAGTYRIASAGSKIRLYAVIFEYYAD